MGQAIATSRIGALIQNYKIIPYSYYTISCEFGTQSTIFHIQPAQIPFSLCLEVCVPLLGHLLRIFTQ
jgi:hypothetical protein